MFERIEPPVLDTKDPWSGALFRRKEYADTLCALLKKTSRSSVIGINAPYGFGKTFFLQRLREQIKNESGWVIYVNAWEYDYLESPLFALLDALKVAAAESPQSDKIMTNLSKVGKALAPTIVKAVSKKATEYVLGTEGSKDIAEVIADASGKTAEAIINGLLKEETTHRMLNTLREEIRTFVRGNINDKSNYNNLIIIIDELDRAKPNFSIRLLEAIKHIFTLSDVIFLIGCDRSVLVSSAQHEYGMSLPIDGYMRRLFDYWIDLPPPDSRGYVAQCARTLNLLSGDGFSSERNVSDGIETYSDFLLLFDDKNGASLRFIEQSVAHAGTVLRLVANDKHAGLIGWLQGIRHFAPDIYEICVSNQTVSNVFRALSLSVPFQQSRPFHKLWILIWAANAAEPLTRTVVDRLFGVPNKLGEMLERISFQHNYNFDYPESMAYRINRQLRMVSNVIR
jgi:hypothetical protein